MHMCIIYICFTKAGQALDFDRYIISVDCFMLFVLYGVLRCRIIIELGLFYYSSFMSKSRRKFGILVSKC